MSLVRSAALFRSCDLYSMKDGNDGSGLSTLMFNSDDHRMIYTTGSHGIESYDPKYFLDSQSNFDVQRNPFHQQESPLVPSTLAAYEFTFESDFDSRTPENVDCDEDKMRLKLQELEKALLDDNNDHEESSSSDSNLSSISSKEISTSTPQSLKNLLFECAAAVHNGNFDEATYMINMLRQQVSIHGDPSERTAAYMVEALAARMATSGRGLYSALKCKEPPSSDRLSAMQILFEVCPCFRFGFMAANGALLEAFKDEKRVHIIDFDINQGSQYYTLLQTLARSPGNRPHVRLTGVDDPESVRRAVGGLKIIGQRLEQLADDLHLSFEFQAVAAETALVSPSVLNCWPGEALVVNFAFQLHHLPDESVSTVNLRDQLLRMVKNMKPKLMTVVEQELNTNTSAFLQRFAEAYDYYSAVFDSIDATLTRDSQDRINVEKHCLARDIINVVACEGPERIERFEVAGKWRARMVMAGFAPCPISEDMQDELRKFIKQYSDRYKVKEETGALYFGWEGKTLVVCSAWR